MDIMDIRDIMEVLVIMDIMDIIYIMIITAWLAMAGAVSALVMYGHTLPVSKCTTAYVTLVLFY